MNYFDDKIAQIRSKFDTNIHSINAVAHNNVLNNLTHFESYRRNSLPMIQYLSLVQGSMACLKSAILHPLIKYLDTVIDKDIFKNYKPVSNLVTISRLIGRFVRIRLTKHMTEMKFILNSSMDIKRVTQWKVYKL